MQLYANARRGNLLALEMLNTNENRHAVKIHHSCYKCSEFLVVEGWLLFGLIHLGSYKHKILITDTGLIRSFAYQNFFSDLILLKLGVCESANQT